MSEIAVRDVARFIAKAEKVEEVKSILSGFVDPTRAEKGCVTYELLQNRTDPCDLTFVEEWESETDLLIHSQSEHLREGRIKLDGLLEQTADVRKYFLIK